MGTVVQVNRRQEVPAGWISSRSQVESEDKIASSKAHIPHSKLLGDNSKDIRNTSTHTITHKM